MRRGRVIVLSQAKSRAVFVILGLLFFAAGIGMVFWWGIPTLQKAKASTSWPTTRGVVVASDIERDVSEDHDDRRSVTYHARVTCEYTVAGTIYNCNTVSFGQYGSSNRNHARQIVNRYPVGKTVDVHYDPEKPASAVLEPGVSLISYLALGAGIMVGLAGAMLLIKTIVSGKRRGSPTSQQPAAPLQGDYPSRL